ncbi:uncharacterized protein YyaL (SSP411 family) [Methanolinea mesophila]|uniref:thioredoxin domain-containing protein n=1 Tax=Methanolinea mesophila TaxID=547055 RepID=UPI001AE782B6|nr:thioredoxin domain-containing protein [Methanolinea mesophila]MBP1929594.1 uncharacterized protein YyaL (SSP411 family) [Methanolinea mesophila]
MRSDDPIGIGPGGGSRHRNRLAGEKSPYLLQHATNPVDWYPWSDEAFSRASDEDKPVFLSIGYATCHWCHVMERESFEDEEVALALNSRFISVKVDREERPDIDQVYMNVCQMLTGSGGWPLSIFMTPDKKPFYAATYIPRRAAGGRPGILEILDRIADLWKSDRDRAVAAAGEITRSLREGPGRAPVRRPDVNLMAQASADLRLAFDHSFGGFGGAPKFPMFHTLMMLLRVHHRSGDSAAMSMVEKSLDMMHQGGIYDHLGYGFHRYSTDYRWLVPHFEKMLYDQALGIMAYTETFLVTREPRYRKIALECLEFVKNDLTSPEGAFYSAIDADSEGKEGKYYLWTRDDIDRALGPGEAALVKKIYRVQSGGNFVDPFAGGRTGENILYLSAPLDEHARSMGIPRSMLEERLGSARKKLLATRRERVPPLRDDKVLTDWNGLMIAAASRAGAAFGDPGIVGAAEHAAGFLRDRLLCAEGRLLHRFREGDAGIEGKAPDYAFSIFGMIELYQASGDYGHLETALAMEHYFSSHFWDSSSGGYFMTPETEKDLITRPKELHGGAIPSYNGVACHNLFRLSLITGDRKYEARGREILRRTGGVLHSSPSAFPFMIMGIDLMKGPSGRVLVAGGKHDPAASRLCDVIRTGFYPRTVLARVDPAVALPDIDGGATYHGKDGAAAAYLCVDQSCRTPVTGEDALLALLSESGA